MNESERPTKEMHRVVAAVILDDEGRILIAQRLPKAVFPLKWEFPGGKVEPGETDEEALRREIEEELGVEIEVGEALGRKVHEYEEFIVDFRVYKTRIIKGIPKPIQAAAIRWVRPSELKEYPFPPADEDAIARLLEEER